MSSLLGTIKNEIAKSGSNKGKIFYVREGQKVRVRFLKDMEDGLEITFHDSYEQGINLPCQEIFDRDCEYCEMEGLRTRSLFAWPVYDYESNEVKVFLFAVNNCSPLPALVSMYETYGTLTDRDYVIGVTGKQQNKTYSVVPMDKNKFRNSKAKPLSESAILKIIDSAFPNPNEYSTNKKSKTRKMQEEIDDDWDDEEEENPYEGMTAKELYKMCKSKGIDVEPRKSEKYYINELIEYDEMNEDWGE